MFPVHVAPHFAPGDKVALIPRAADQFEAEGATRHEKTLKVDKDLLVEVEAEAGNYWLVGEGGSPTISIVIPEGSAKKGWPPKSAAPKPAKDSIIPAPEPSPDFGDPKPTSFGDLPEATSDSRVTALGDIPESRAAGDVPDIPSSLGDIAGAREETSVKEGTKPKAPVATARGEFGNEMAGIDDTEYVDPEQ